MNYELQENPITTEIIRGAFISAALEMNETLFRSSYSPIIYESKDCAAGLFNLDYGVLGLSAGVPAFLGNLEVTIEKTTEYIGGLDKYQEGDVFILNDAYMTGAHLNDMTLLSPIFYQGQLVGFTANRAHWLDIGSKDSGYPMDSTTIYQEGIRIPPIKIVENGILKEDIADFICRNTRFYRSSRGDLNAQIASCKTGEDRYIALIERFGLETLQRSTQDIFNQSDAMEREVIRSIPDGEYTAEGCLDNDGTTGEPVYIKVKVIVDGDNMVIDLTGSNKAAVGSTNCGIAQTISACRMAYKMIISPLSSVSGGSFRALDVIAPEGSIFYAEEPTACAWYFTSLGLMIDLVAKAMEEVIPDKVAAAHYGDSMVIYLSGKDPRNDNNPYLYVEATVGGWGAHAAGDGQDALINTLNGVYKNIPVEVFESNYPVKINSFKIRQDSGGPGIFRGGNGITKEYEALYDDTYLFLWFERSVTPAWGINGGQAGAPPDVIVKGDNGEDVHMLKVNAYPLKKGQVVVANTGGGGGFGNAFERDYDRVLEDYKEGYISEKQAKDKYGVIFTEGGEVDVEASNHLRSIVLQ